MRNALKINLVLMLLIFTLPFISSALISNPQYTQFMGAGAGDFDSSMCQQGQDFLIQIVPAGCSPVVVRSDLLEEQNVPVFCQLGATKINPLIDVEAVESISFSGEYPEEVEGIAFHPAQAALGIKGDLSSPILSNIGYVVVVLKQQKNASAMPDYVSGNLTAKIKYDIKNAFGIGKASFYLPEMSDADWEIKKSQYSFWNGKGTLRAESVDEDSAVISVYSKDKKISSISLEKGEKSNEIYLPGFDCAASLQVKLDGLKNPDTRALLKINSEVVEVAREEMFLENKCQITHLEKQGLLQRVKIKCREDEGVKNFNLLISPKVILEIDGEEEEVGLGEKLYTDGNKSIYLAYIGTKKETGNAEDLHILLVSKPNEDSLTENDLTKYSSLAEGLLDVGTTKNKVISAVEDVVGASVAILNILLRAIAKGERFYITSYGEEAGTAFGKNVALRDFAEPRDLNLGDETREYYGLAVDDYETISGSFAGEKHYRNADITLGEETLYREITLAWDIQQRAKVVELCEDFEILYPNSNKNLAGYCDNDYGLSSQEISVAYLTINAESKKISFDGIYEPSREDYSVKISVSGAGNSAGGVLRKNGEFYISESEFIVLKDLEQDYAVFDVSNVKYGKLKEGIQYDIQKLKIGLGEKKNIGEANYGIGVEEINLKKSAKVTLIPGFEDAGTEASFDFKIGIEKRTFTLSPDKVKNEIEKLNEQISKWQNFSDKLEGVVDGLGKACLATGAALTFKNLMANFGGKGIARNYVMSADNGWYEKCADFVNAEDYISVEQCLLKNSDSIEGDVNSLAELIGEQNKKIKTLEAGSLKQETFGSSVVNTSDFMSKYSEKVISSLREKEITGPSGKEEAISSQDISEILSYESWENKNYNQGQLREIELWAGVLSKEGVSDDLKKVAQANLYSVLYDVKTNAKDYIEVSGWAGELGISPKDIPFVEIGDKMKKYNYGDWTNGNLGNPIGGVGGETPLGIAYDSNGKKYIFVLDNSVGGENLPIKKTDKDFSDFEKWVTDKYKTYTNCITGINKDYPSLAEASCKRLFLEPRDLMIYDSSGNLLTDVPDEIKNIYFVKYDVSSYKNKYKNAEVKYYETEPYKGRPAIVPFDLDNGWYAATKQTVAIFGNIASYDDSGAVNSFYLCNVGKNELEENIGGDDICEMINLGTGQPYDQFPGLNENEAKKLVNNAQKAIKQASKSYKVGLSGNINILGQGIKVGAPAVDNLGIKCTDVMSPKDCQIMFNVCDPVICPSSRCDLGGAYPVRRVQETGIIGSLVLCLPNIQEGIFVPICLSGVQAGIEGWLSVQTGHRDCLQHKSDTGETIGICDEVHSIYACEFFWRQALPLADFALPKIIAALVGQNVRGGGEYLSVAHAWDTAKDSITYFTQYYEADASRAFNILDTDSVGTEVCKLSVSAIYANSVDVIDSLTEPVSPAQYTAWFDEISFSTATSPPTSHYKVFYHIYAGDEGTYYQVYLSGVPGTSYYQGTSSTRVVASGYIEAGGYASDAKDFTAPSGYQKLCVSVNGQEECGFQEVSSSFAVDYISDKYVASQVENTEITTAKQCISGSASLYSLLNPNLQDAAEELLDPAIYNKGVIRTCATDNPGEGSDSYAETENSRWVQVGYCGEENMECWLDTYSVKDAIDISFIGEQALEEVTPDYLDVLRNQEGYLSKEEFASKVKEIEDEENAEKRLTLIGEIFGKVFLNSEKGYLFLLRGNAYAVLARGSIPEPTLETPKPTEPEIEEVVPGVELGTETYEIDRIGFKLITGGSEKVEFDGDVDKYANSEVELVVEHEENCEYAEYQVYLKSVESEDGFFAKIWKGIVGVFKGFKWAETISGRTDEDSMNTILNNLDKGAYFVEGYCFNPGGTEKDVTDSNTLLVKSVSYGVEGIPSVEERYQKLKDIFNKYAKENLPDGWNPNKFKALLVAIAIRQSNLGYPEGVYDPTWIMEYGWEGGVRKEEYSGAENQVDSASKTLKIELDKTSASESPYYGCRGNLRCVLSVYYTGQRSRILSKTDGEQYADETIEIMGELERYFKDTEGLEWFKD